MYFLTLFSVAKCFRISFRFIVTFRSKLICTHIYACVCVCVCREKLKLFLVSTFDIRYSTFDLFFSFNCNCACGILRSLKNHFNCYPIRSFIYIYIYYIILVFRILVYYIIMIYLLAFCYVVFHMYFILLYL